MRVLVVEDTHDVGEAMVEAIRSLGQAVDWVRTAEDACDIVATTEYQLILLDLTLPGATGTTVLQKLRDDRNPASVLIVTARSKVDDRIYLLDLGADDYLTKPFDFRELKARVRSLLRRQCGERGSKIILGTVTFDRAARTATSDGKPIALTNRETSLLEVFLTRPKMVFSKGQLLDQLFDFSAEPSENSVEVLVARLRRKLSGTGLVILTKHGMGYQIAEECQPA